MTTISPWTEWEDWSAGMYGTDQADEMVRESAFLLTDPGRFHETAREMLREWPRSAHQNLHLLWSGRNAWLGQATCCYSHGATAAATRTAWASLTNRQQAAANAIAVSVRTEWDKRRVDEALPGM